MSKRRTQAIGVIANFRIFVPEEKASDLTKALKLAASTNSDMPSPLLSTMRSVALDLETNQEIPSGSSSSVTIALRSVILTMTMLSRERSDGDVITVITDGVLVSETVTEVNDSDNISDPLTAVVVGLGVTATVLLILTLIVCYSRRDVLFGKGKAHIKIYQAEGSPRDVEANDSPSDAKGDENAHLSLAAANPPSPIEANPPAPHQEQKGEDAHFARGDSADPLPPLQLTPQFSSDRMLGPPDWMLASVKTHVENAPILGPPAWMLQGDLQKPEELPSSGAKPDDAAIGE
jgi:hypothetical protein